MTSEEKDLLYAAEMLMDYCNLQEECTNCFFYRKRYPYTFSDCILHVRDPDQWELEKCKLEEGDQSNVHPDI